VRVGRRREGELGEKERRDVFQGLMDMLETLGESGKGGIGEAGSEG
jgi:hypothetical protein